MKASAVIVAAIILPGGFILASMAVVAYVLARHRNARDEDDGTTTPAR